ncbi:centlein [Tachyglossus aculeatus]|uniref:centlein n=1 Tax=Tachyglossus aculeatus TaxID=9261 RepID=UPI0018F5A704|nr:centlein [Tachyglossus aculeatus]
MVQSLDVDNKEWIMLMKLFSVKLEEPFLCQKIPAGRVHPSQTLSQAASMLLASHKTKNNTLLGKRPKSNHPWEAGQERNYDLQGLRFLHVPPSFFMVLRKLCYDTGEDNDIRKGSGPNSGSEPPTLAILSIVQDNLFDVHSKLTFKSYDFTLPVLLDMRRNHSRFPNVPNKATEEAEYKIEDKMNILSGAWWKVQYPVVKGCKEGKNSNYLPQSSHCLKECHSLSDMYQGGSKDVVPCLHFLGIAFDEMVSNRYGDWWVEDHSQEGNAGLLHAHPLWRCVKYFDMYTHGGRHGPRGFLKRWNCYTRDDPPKQSPPDGISEMEKLLRLLGLQISGSFLNRHNGLTRTLALELVAFTNHRLSYQEQGRETVDTQLMALQIQDHQEPHFWENSSGGQGCGRPEPSHCGHVALYQERLTSATITAKEEIRRQNTPLCPLPPTHIPPPLPPFFPKRKDSIEQGNAILRLALPKDPTGPYVNGKISVSGLVHNYGMLWKQGGCRTSAGTAIKHGQLVSKLLEVLFLPSRNTRHTCQLLLLPEEMLPLINPALPRRRGPERGEKAAQAGLRGLLSGEAVPKAKLEAGGGGARAFPGAGRAFWRSAVGAKPVSRPSPPGLPPFPPKMARVRRLEEEISSLREELSQCQADKEFVWSLWKRLEVENPDLTLAISWVVEREKYKAQIKDRKVLEILQVKDVRIQELEQRESGQQQEINNLVKRKIAVDEENIFLKNEFSDLQQKFNDKNQELKDTKECARKKEERSRLVIKNLEEENEGLNTRCTDLLNDLEKLRKQEAQWRLEKSGIDDKVKSLEANLTESRKHIEELHSKCNDLSSQLTMNQTELIQKDMDITLFRKELQELQNLYKQNTEHTAQQAELIQQLQALNVDTQKVLRKQEDAHTAETISYQKLYNELNTCFETVKTNEAQLRQSYISLKNQLLQKEQETIQLKLKLEEALSTPQTLSQVAQLQHLEQDFKHSSLPHLECLIASQKSEIRHLEEKLKTANLQLSEHCTCSRDFLNRIILKSERKHKEPPVKRSRSLSPKSTFRDSEELKKLKIAEWKIENLEKTLQLKIQENDELREAHEKRKERLQMLQTNYRAVKEQLKQWEEGCSKSEIRERKIQRADPQQLRQEDSDAVWNELAYFKREHKKLLIAKLHLEEELDQLKVHRSMDKATIQELNSYLKQEQEADLLFRLGEDDGVKNSTPKKNVKEMLDQTLQKVSHMEKKLLSFEEKSKQLKEVNEELTKDNHGMKVSLKQYREAAECRERELEHLLKGNREMKRDKAELQVKLGKLEKEVTSLQGQVAEANGLRKENEELLTQVQKLQPLVDEAKAWMATVGEGCGRCDSKATSTKVKFKTGKKKSSMGCHQAFLNQSIKVTSNMFENFSKDGWEDVSESSDSEIQTSECQAEITLKDSPTRDGKDHQRKYQTEDNHMTQTESNVECREQLYPKKRNIHKKDFVKSSIKRTQFPSKKFYPSTITKVTREKRKNIYIQKPGNSVVLLRDRIMSLQQQVLILQSAKRTAEASIKEFKSSNEKLINQQNVMDQKLMSSKKVIQKLNSDLAELRKERDDLHRKLESASVATCLTDLSTVTSQPIQVAPSDSSKNIDTEMKHLQCKLKNVTNKITKQSSTIKSLKNQVQEKDDRIRELQEKVSRMERDVHMKRHLIEDLRSRLKVNQETDKSFNEVLENFEKKVKTLTEDCSNKKASIDSLKQRLNVAVREKSQYEQMYHKAKDELGKKDLRLSNLLSKVTETETAMSDLENTASQQLHELAIQSRQNLEGVKKKLISANDRVEEFITFVKALAQVLQSNIQEMRRRIRETKKMQYNRKLSKGSVRRAQSLAASILNISKTDLEEILDTEDEEEIEKAKMASENDKAWLQYIQKLLEGKFPFSSYLIDAVLEKLNEKKKLVEEYITIMKDSR